MVEVDVDDTIAEGICIAVLSDEKCECGFVDGVGDVGGSGDASTGRAVGRGDVLTGGGLKRGDVVAAGGRAAALTGGWLGRAEALTGGGRLETTGREDMCTGAGRTDCARAGSAGVNELLCAATPDTE